MARTELTSSLKFKRLVKRLGLPVPYVVGLLECMWHTAYQAGTSELGDWQDVETAAQWPGDPREFAKAVAAERFVDLNGRVYHVHDLYDHAPDYVKKRMRRRNRTAPNARNSNDFDDPKNSGQKGTVIATSCGAIDSKTVASNSNDLQQKMDAKRRTMADSGCQTADNGCSTQPNPTQPNPTHAPDRPAVDGVGVDGVADDAEIMRARIQSYITDQPALPPWDHRQQEDMEKLVRAVGWDRAHAMVMDAIRDGKKFAIAYARGRAQGEVTREAAAEPAPRKSITKVIIRGEV